MKKLILSILTFCLAIGMQTSAVFPVPDQFKAVTLKAIKNTPKVIVAYNDNDDKYGIFIYDTDINKTLGFLELNSSVNDIAVVENTAYLAVSHTKDDNKQLIVVDISDSNDLKIKDAIEVYPTGDLESAYHVKVSEDSTTLAVSLYHTGVALFDIGNQDIKLTAFITKYTEGLIALNDSYLFIFNTPKEDLYEAVSYDISDKTSPTPIDTFTGNSFKDALIAENKLYVTDNWNNILKSYDISDGKFNQQSAVSFERTINYLAYDGNLYVTLGAGGYEDIPSIVKTDPQNLNKTEEINLSELGYMELNALDYSDSKLVTATDYAIAVISLQAVVNTSETSSFTVKLQKGWNLIGAMENVNTQNLPPCIQIAWIYDNGWKLYTSYPTEDNYGFEKLLSIEKGKGFWVYTSEECELSFNSSDIYAIYNFDDGFYNSKTGQNDENKWENSANVVVEDGSLDLINNFDNDPKSWTATTIDTSSVNKLIVKKRTFLTSSPKTTNKYTLSSMVISNSDKEYVAVKYNDYHYDSDSDLTHIINYANKESFYLQNVWDFKDINNFYYTISNKLSPVWNQWLYEKLTIDYQNNTATYEYSTDNITFYKAEISDLHLQRDENTSLYFSAWDWSGGSEHKIDTLEIDFE